MHATRQGLDFKTHQIKWKTRRGPANAGHLDNPATGESLWIDIQKSIVTSPARKHAKVNADWNAYHAADLLKRERHLSYGDELVDYAKTKRQYDNAVATQRWSWSQDSVSEDYIMALISHENGHAIQHNYGLVNKFRDSLARNNVTATDVFKVSEYAATNNNELFAEVTSAIAQGRQSELPVNVLKAYNETISTIPR